MPVGGRRVRPDTNLLQNAFFKYNCSNLIYSSRTLPFPIELESVSHLLNLGRLVISLTQCVKSVQCDFPARLEKVVQLLPAVNMSLQNVLNIYSWNPGITL